MGRKGSACVVLITHPIRGAAAFARGLVEQRLAACVNRIPIRSTYRWKGALKEAGEVLLLVKTSDTRLEALYHAIHASHPYELPELVVLAPAWVGADYQAWVLAETAARRGDRR